MTRVLIVDDEELARAHLRRLLSAEGSVEIIGEAANGPQALEQIAEISPAVVFLDIEMPAMTGFEVVQNLPEDGPLVVFATAYDEFAVRAFEANALDYLLKPVQPARVRQTLARIRAVLHSGASEYRDAMRDVLSAVDRERGAPLSRLAARRGKRIVLLPLPEILHVTIDDKLVFAHTLSDRFLLDRTVTELERLLEPSGFRRINRGTLVNVEHVRELVPWFSGTYRIKLSSGLELDLSRDRARPFTQAMGV